MCKGRGKREREGSSYLLFIYKEKEKEREVGMSGGCVATQSLCKLQMGA